MKSAAARSLGARDAPGRLGPLWTILFRYGPPRWTEYVLKNWSGQRLVIAVPYLWLLMFFLVPFLIVLKISFAEYSALGRPPYVPVFQWLDDDRFAMVVHGTAGIGRVPTGDLLVCRISDGRCLTVASGPQDWLLPGGFGGVGAEG